MLVPVTGTLVSNRLAWRRLIEFLCTQVGPSPDCRSFDNDDNDKACTCPLHPLHLHHAGMESFPACRCLMAGIQDKHLHLRTQETLLPAQVIHAVDASHASMSHQPIASSACCLHEVMQGFFTRQQTSYLSAPPTTSMTTWSSCLMLS